MKSKKTFTEKVRAMDAHDIIMAMVKGLQKPTTKIDMRTYGAVHVFNNRRVCFGCAATNTICKIGGYTTTDILKADKKFPGISDMRHVVNASQEYFVAYFEVAINSLRSGSVSSYNDYAKKIKIAEIKRGVFNLPHLYNDYTAADLKPYIALAKFQREKR